MNRPSRIIIFFVVRLFFRSLFLFLALLLPVRLLSQAYHFKTYLIEQSQGIKQVRAMMQDSKGYLWFGTSGSGLCRYDGKNYDFFSKKNGLCSDDVNCIAEDKEGNIWFGTAAGISKLHNNRFTNFSEFENISVSSITRDKQNNLWFGTSSGLLKYDGKTFSRFMEKDGLLNNFVLTVFCDKKGKLWFGTVNGKIFHYKNSQFQNTGNAANAINERIWSFYEDRNGILWIGADNGLWAYNPEKNTINKTEITTAVFDISEDAEGNLWIATSESGIIRYDGKQFINFSEKNLFGSNPVYALVRDREGAMWFGIYGVGVARLNIQGYEIHTKNNGLSNSFIWTAKQDHSGNIWVGYNSPGISVIMHNEIKREREIYTFPTEAFVYCIFFENENTIWAGTANGIEIFNYDHEKKSLRNIKTFSLKDGLAGESVRCIYKDKKNNIWVGTNLGLSLLKKNNAGNYSIVKSFNAENGLVNNYVFSIIEDNEGSFWLATAGGLSKFIYGENLSDIKFKNYTINEGLANHDVRTIVIDDKGRAWFATGTGISMYKKENDSFLNYTSKDGLSSERLYFMQYDKMRNVLWVGSAFGIDKFDLNEYDKNGKIIFTHPTAYDGFIEVETNTNAVFLDNKNHLWLGSIDGLIKYFPDYIRPKNKVEPLTHITKISVDKKDTLLKQNASLPFYQNNITFHFRGISLSMPERVQYRYMLEGFDKDWSPDTKETSATYSNLPSGNYTFKVLSCNNDGVWNTVPALFSITITPPWWQTWWFRAVAGILLLFLVFIYIKWRERNLRKEKEILEEKVRIRTRELAEQKEMVEEKNKEITDSILYAKRIQNALLTSEKYMKQNLPEHFIFFKPKDIVSGDFYWAFKPDKNSILFAVADCTGHGVPGAMMSMIGMNKLSEIVIEKKITQPDKILNALREEIIFALNPDENYDTAEESYSEVKDGMDISLIRLSVGTPSKEQDSADALPTRYLSGLNPIAIGSRLSTKLQYAGANNPVWIERKAENTLIELTPDIFPVGKHRGTAKPFSLKTLELQKGDCVYLFSDGYPDQFGGPKGKKFKYRQLKQMLLDMKENTVAEKKKIISETFENWKGNLTQVDDICLAGIRI